MIVSTHAAIHPYRLGELRLPAGLGAGLGLHPLAVGASWLELNTAPSDLDLPTAELGVDRRGRFRLGERGLRHRFAVEDGEPVQVYAWVHHDGQLTVWARAISAVRPPDPRDRPRDVLFVRHPRPGHPG